MARVHELIEDGVGCRLEYVEDGRVVIQATWGEAGASARRPGRRGYTTEPPG